MAATVAAAALAAGTAGCGGEATAAVPPGALALVVGAHANAPTPRLAGSAAAALDMATAQESTVALVVADGLPYLSGEPTALTVDDEDLDAAEAARQEHRERVQDAVVTARPVTGETDLLGALTLAGQTIAEVPGMHVVVVVDSGLSTTGALDLTAPGMLDADPQYVADSLGDFGQLPDLRDASVVFQGLGETTDPQQPLEPWQRAHLAAIWTAVAEKAGATTVEVESSPPTEARATTSAAGLSVRTVTPPPDVVCEGNRVTIRGGRLEFPTDSDVLLDLKAAVEAVRPLAEQMQAQDLEAVLYGTSAAVGTPQGRTKLSENRAQAVANLFIGLGVLIPQLHVEGRGSDYPGLVPDHDAAGNLLPGPAALNNKVVIEFSAPVTCD